jgi:hypothetical protein
MPHRIRRDAVKVCPALPSQVLVIGQAEVRFMNQHRRLEGDRAAAPEKARRQPPQLVVNDRHQAVQGGAVPPAPIDQERRELLSRGHAIAPPEANQLGIHTSFYDL